MIIDDTDNEFLYEKYYKPLYAPIGDKNFIPTIKRGPKKFDGVLILGCKIIEDYDFQNNTVVEFKYPDVKSAWILLDDGFQVICFFEDMVLDSKRMRELKFKGILNEV